MSVLQYNCAGPLHVHRSRSMPLSRSREYAWLAIKAWQLLRSQACVDSYWLAPFGDIQDMYIHRQSTSESKGIRAIKVYTLYRYIRNAREPAHGRIQVLQQPISSAGQRQTQATFVLHRLLGHPSDRPESPAAALAAIMPHAHALACS